MSVCQQYTGEKTIKLNIIHTKIQIKMEIRIKKHECMINKKGTKSLEF